MLTEEQFNRVIEAIESVKTRVIVPAVGAPDIHVQAPRVTNVIPVPTVKIEIPSQRISIAILSSLFVFDIWLRILEIIRVYH